MASPEATQKEEKLLVVVCRGWTGNEGVCPMVHHRGSVLLHDGASGDMEVNQHGVTAPSTDQLDGVGVDLAEEEGHGTSGAEGAGGDFLWAESHRVPDAGG